jgi:hypothetical protein
MLEEFSTAWAGVSAHSANASAAVAAAAARAVAAVVVVKYYIYISNLYNVLFMLAND